MQLLVRHLLMLLSGALAAHHFTNLNTSAGLILALICFAIGTLWSWLGKLLHIEDKYGDFTKSEAFRSLLGALISQGITAASAYFAIDANDPNLLAVAAINALASRYGLHQQLVHQTPIATAAAIKALALCSLLSLSSCATATAFLNSPFGRAVIASADQLAAQVVKTTERVGLEQIITQASAKVAALNAQGVNTDPVKETLRLSEIAGFTSVVDLAQDKYKALTGARFTLPKNPVSVAP